MVYCWDENPAGDQCCRGQTGDIHLGHLVEHIQTDIFVRMNKLMGHTCYYMRADDAHGTAIMLSAQREGMTLEDYIDRITKLE